MFNIPKEVSHVTNTLKNANFEAFLVGGCVRDLILGRTPKDWDVTTNATPDQIIALFPKTFYENTFGTVGVVNEECEEPSLKIVEVTPYRKESAYSDNRHPDNVEFSEKIDEDLQRRDFTINAIAYDSSADLIIDPFNGRKDLELKLIKAVGDPDQRFKEDGLRMLRAIRLASELDFTISSETALSIFNDSALLKNIAFERIRDELIRILNSDKPMQGIVFAQKLNLLGYIIPELLEGVGCEQNQAHSFDVFEHLLRSLQHAADKKWDFEIRISALLHDVGKPKTREFSKEKKEWTFYNHEVVGSRMAKIILERLKFPKRLIETVCKLIRWHMFFSDTENITLSAVRRIVANVGKENIEKLTNLRMCDRIGTGRPKEDPYRLRKYKAMIDEVMRDPVSVTSLKLNGGNIIEITNSKAGPRIGHILYALFYEVIEDPKMNTVELLTLRVKELDTLSDVELFLKGQEGRKIIEEENKKAVESINKKHFVK